MENWTTKDELKKYYFEHLPSEYLQNNLQNDKGRHRSVEAFKNWFFGFHVYRFENHGYAVRRWLGKPKQAGSDWEIKLTEKGRTLKAPAESYFKSASAEAVFNKIRKNNKSLPEEIIARIASEYVCRSKTHNLKALATKYGVSAMTICNYLKGRVPGAYRNALSSDPSPKSKSPPGALV